MEIIKSIVRIGNSAGVVLPKEWLHGKARVELVEKPLDIKRDVLEILGPYFEDIIGIYLVGSYARSEATSRSDIDILVISKDIRKKIVSEKYEIEIIPLADIISLLKQQPIMIYPKLVDAKVILNRSFLEEIKQSKLDIESFRPYLKDCKRIIKIDREFIELDKLEGNLLDSETVVYSSILRLRALYMIKCIFEKKDYSNKNFKKWIMTKLNITARNFEDVYEIYRSIRDDKISKEKIEISLAEKLVHLLEKEVDKYGKKKKKA